MAIKYGGKTTPDYSAMQGPCNKGFHVPMESERQIIKTAVETWWSGNGAGQVMALASYLKIPLGGYLARTTGALSGKGSWGTYWMCTSPTSSQGRSFDIQSSSISLSNSEKGLGQSIRPFKDIPVVPDSNWTVEHQGTGTAGIYSNATLGLISISSDGENWVTIADKNIGATTVYSYVDTLSETNCGYFFQRGNNYGFPYTGAVTTSSTAVNTTGYGPGNYYSNSTFIKKANWSSSINYNLWGGTTGIVQRPVDLAERYYGGKLVDDYSAMRGPCDEGFHIPTRDEWDAVLTAGATIGAWIRTTSSGQSSTSAYPCRYYLKIPRMDYISNTGEMVTASRFSWVSYHISTANSTGLKGRYVGVISSNGYVPTTLSASINSNCHGYPIRPFKDGAVIPDNTWTMTYDGSSTAAGAGIFYNSSLGLISISSDGNTRYTIADRDIGASEAYNRTNGTIQVGAKGKVFQRGNNYGFTTSETFTTGTDTVDPTGYGPGNYYYSTTFITGGNMYSTGNSNLRGGVTGVQQRPAEVIKVYKGNTLIREKP